MTLFLSVTKLYHDIPLPFDLFYHYVRRSADDSLSRLTAIRFRRNLKTPTEHKNPHHGERPPPLAVRILQLIPIRHKLGADEWLGEVSVKAIY